MQVVHIEKARVKKLAESVEHYAKIFKTLEEAGWKPPLQPGYGTSTLPLAHVAKSLRRELEDG